MEEGLMTGDVMFHEFIKKSDKKDGLKRELSDDEESLEEIKVEEEIKEETVENDKKIKNKKKKNN